MDGVDIVGNSPSIQVKVWASKGHGHVDLISQRSLGPCSIHYTINYLSGPIVSQDEFEMMAPSNGFSLLGRQKKVGSSLSTLETTCCVLRDLKKETNRSANATDTLL